MDLLKDNKIYLRALEPDDVPFLYAMENDASVWNAGSNIQPFSAQSLRDYIENQQADLYADKQLRMVVCLCDDNTPVGLVDLYDFSPRHQYAWVAIMVANNHRGEGVACSALNLLADYAFNFLHLRLLMAMVAADNVASINLFNSAGYIQCGCFPQYYLCGTSPVDGFCFQLLSK